MKFKTQLFDELAVRRALMRLSYEIVEKCADLNNIALIGIHTRGVPIAKMIADNIRKNIGCDVLLSSLDITRYRDDVSKPQQPTVRPTEIPFDISGREVILVDDVLYTGRTVRAAMDALFAHGRPAQIRLAVLVDRGHRELPIRPDFVGKNIPTSKREVVRVHMPEHDGKLNVELYEREETDCVQG